MKNRIVYICVLFISMGLVTNAIAQEKILLCDKDIYDTSHPFYWNNLKSIVPDNLGPGEANKVYGEIFHRYMLSLGQEAKQQAFVKKFIKLQQNIIAGVTSANLSMKPGLDGVELSSGSEIVGTVPCQDKDKPYLVTIKYVTIAYKKVHDASWETLRGAVSRQIELRDQQYTDWFTNGLPMWPLETWANGKLLDKSDAIKPKDWQLVVVRPTVGLGVNSNDGIRDTKPEMTLAIEPIGYVKYTKKDYSSYWGVSFLMTAGDDHGIGYGALARYNNYVLGIVKRRKDNLALGVKGDDLYVFIGFDLYELVHKKQEEFRYFKGKVRENLEKYKQAVQ